jgi:hypothetical protein
VVCVVCSNGGHCSQSIMMYSRCGSVVFYDYYVKVAN